MPKDDKKKEDKLKRKRLKFATKKAKGAVSESVSEAAKKGELTAKGDISLKESKEQEVSGAKRKQKSKKLFVSGDVKKQAEDKSPKQEPKKEEPTAGVIFVRAEGSGGKGGSGDKVLGSTEGRMKESEIKKSTGDGKQKVSGETAKNIESLRDRTGGKLTDIASKDKQEEPKSEGEKKEGSKNLLRSIRRSPQTHTRKSVQKENKRKIKSKQTRTFATKEDAKEALREVKKDTKGSRANAYRLGKKVKLKAKKDKKKNNRTWGYR